MRPIVPAFRALVLRRWICKYMLSLHISVYNLVLEAQYTMGVQRRETKMNTLLILFHKIVSLCNCSLFLGAQNTNGLRSREDN